MDLLNATELCTLFIDPDIDNAVRAESQLKNVGRNVLLVHYLQNGMAATDTGRASKRALPERILVMRTIYMPIALDDTLRNRAFFEKTKRNDLVRRFIRAGMELGLEVPAVKKRGRKPKAAQA